MGGSGFVHQRVRITMKCEDLRCPFYIEDCSQSPEEKRDIEVGLNERMQAPRFLLAEKFQKIVNWLNLAKTSFRYRGRFSTTKDVLRQQKPC